MSSSEVGSLKLRFDVDTKSAEKSIKSFGEIARESIIANVAQKGFDVATNAIKKFASSSIEVGKNFEKSMSEVAAISGATGDDLAMLERTAREFGASTQFSASEAADALKYMALAGWDANQSSSALGGVLDLAAASGMDLAAASEMVTDYLSAFGMEAEQSSYFADMLSYAQANSHTTAEALGEAYKNCAANLNAAGQDVETATSLLAMMANQGLKGSLAGTALNAVIRDMTAKMKDGAIAIGNTTVQVMDANGNYRDMTDILKDVEKATNGMGDAEKAAALSSTFTADSIKGLNLILNAGVDEAAAFEEELRNSGGTASDMAAIMNDNLEGKLKSLNSKFEELQIQLFNSLEPVLDVIIDLLGWCADNANILIPIIASLGATIGTVFVVDKINQFTSKAKSVFTSLGNIFGKFKGKVEETASSASTADSSLAKSTKNMAKSGESLSTRLTDAINGIADVITTVFTRLGDILGSVVNAIMEPIKQLFKGLGEAIAGFFQTLANPSLLVGVVVFAAAAAGIAAAILLIGSAIGVVTPALSDFLNSVLIPLVEFIASTMIGVMNEVTDCIIRLTQGALIPMGEFIRDTVLMIITVMTDNIIRLTQEALIPLFREIRTFLDWLFGKVEQVVSNVWNTISNLVSNVKNAFQGAWDFITGIFGNVAGWFRDRFNDAFNAIKNIFSGIGHFFSGIWNQIVSVFGTIGTKVGEAVSGAFKGVVNGVLSAVETILNTPIRAVNGLIDVINNIPGIELGHLNEFNLPRMQYGGIIPGNSWTGDNELIRANSGEMVITRSQQAGLWDFIQNSFSASEGENSPTGSANEPVTINQTNYFEKDLTAEQIEELMSKSIRRAVA